MSVSILEKMTRDSALLVIDVQERFVPAMPVDRLAAVERSARILAELAQHVGATALYTEQYPRGLGPTLSSIRESLERGGATRFEKSHFDACLDETFAATLDALPPRIFVCGIEAHICVRATVHSLRARGFEVIVPHDGVASRRDEDRAIGIARMREMGAMITTMESVVFDTLGCADGDAFKRFSKMVR